MSKRVKTGFDRDVERWMKDPEFAIGYWKARFKLEEYLRRYQRKVLDEVVEFTKLAYCSKKKFDICGDPFCSEAREKLNKILGIEED